MNPSRHLSLALTKGSLGLALCLIAVLQVLFFWGITRDAAVSGDVFGMGRLLGLSACVAVAALALHRSELRKTSGITVVVALWLLYTAATSVSGLVGSSPKEYLTNNLLPLCYWPLTYLLFYVCFQRWPQGWQITAGFFLILALCACVAQQWVYHHYLVEKQAAYSLYINSIYFVLLPLPWVLAVRNRFLHYLGVCVVSFCAATSLKRMAVVLLVSGLASYYLASCVVSRKRIRLIQTVVAAAAIAAAGTYFYGLDQERGGVFGQRFQDLFSSELGGRVEIYHGTLGMLDKATLPSLLFGHGFNSVEADQGISAHNDFLEVVYDHGLVGLFIFLVLHALLLRRCGMLLASRSALAPPFVCSYVVFLCMTLGSHVLIYPAFFAFLLSLWGAVEGLHRGGHEPLIARAGKAVNGAPSARQLTASPL
jgi:hypothetical protein